MPQVELSSSKGLNQKSGQGFADADLATISSALDIGADGTVAQKGALVHLVNTGGAGFAVTLFSASEGAVTGQVKIFIVSASTGGALTINNAAGNPLSNALDAVGDMAICVFNGSDWVAGLSVA